MQKIINKNFLIASLGVVFPWLTILIINYFKINKIYGFFQENNYTIVSILLLIAIFSSLFLIILLIRNKNLIKLKKTILITVGSISVIVSTFFWFLVGVVNNIRIGI